ncbi:hypothetical protein [Streptomyces sp. 2231.1]|uniref:hypothetical protein n=1 Tax=Streptomyces sp. 2231.1 TaxID=1855347 RepID=UPI00115F953D|nr:hypothetical protein [Streptomyces sp. 2231.1]
MRRRTMPSPVVSMSASAPVRARDAFRGSCATGTTVPTGPREETPVSMNVARRDPAGRRAS